jgi:hypothetical protein
MGNFLVTKDATRANDQGENQKKEYAADHRKLDRGGPVSWYPAKMNPHSTVSFRCSIRG